MARGLRGIPDGFDIPSLLGRGSETHAECPITLVPADLRGV